MYDCVYICIFQGRGALQDIDQMSLFEPLCKYTATVKAVRDIVPTVKTALQMAQSGTPGKISTHTFSEPVRRKGKA